MTNWTSALWCENVHRTHIISLVFEYVQLRLINFENILQAELRICEYGRNSEQSHDYAFSRHWINSNCKDFDFVGWVIKTPCLFYFRSVKFHYVKETHDINSLLTLVKIALASQHISNVAYWKHRLGRESVRAAVCKWLLLRISLAFQKLLQTHQTSRSNKKLCKKGFSLWLSIV